MNRLLAGLKSGRAQHAGRLVGLDLGTTSLKIVDSLPNGGHAVRFARLDPGPGLSDRDAVRIARVMQRRSIPLSGVCVAAPRSVIRTAELSLPPRSSGAPVDEIAREECRRLFEYEGPFELALRPLPVGREQGAEPALALACCHESAESIIRPLSEAGISVIRFEPSSVAVARSAGAGSVLTLEIGHASGVMIASESGELRYERELPELSAPALRLEALASSPAWRDSVRERVTDELDRTVRYLSQRFGFAPTAPLRLIGGGVERSVAVIRESVAELGWSCDVGRFGSRYGAASSDPGFALAFSLVTEAASDNSPPMTAVPTAEPAAHTGASQGAAA